METDFPCHGWMSRGMALMWTNLVRMCRACYESCLMDLFKPKTCIVDCNATLPVVIEEWRYLAATEGLQGLIAPVKVLKRSGNDSDSSHLVARASRKLSNILCRMNNAKRNYYYYSPIPLRKQRQVWFCHSASSYAFLQQKPLATDRHRIPCHETFRCRIVCKVSRRATIYIRSTPVHEYHDTGCWSRWISKQWSAMKWHIRSHIASRQVWKVFVVHPLLRYTLYTLVCTPYKSWDFLVAIVLRRLKAGWAQTNQWTWK